MGGTPRLVMKLSSMAEDDEDVGRGCLGKGSFAFGPAKSNPTTRGSLELSLNDGTTFELSRSTLTPRTFTVLSKAATSHSSHVVMTPRSKARANDGAAKSATKKEKPSLFSEWFTCVAR